MLNRDVPPCFFQKKVSELCFLPHLCSTFCSCEYNSASRKTLNSIEILTFVHKHILVCRTDLLFVKGVNNTKENEPACVSLAPWTQIEI